MSLESPSAAEAARKHQPEASFSFVRGARAFVMGLMLSAAVPGAPMAAEKTQVVDKEEEAERKIIASLKDMSIEKCCPTSMTTGSLCEKACTKNCSAAQSLNRRHCRHASALAGCGKRAIADAQNHMILSARLHGQYDGRA